MSIKQAQSTLSVLTEESVLSEQELDAIVGGRGIPMPDFSQNPLDPDTDLPSNGMFPPLKDVPKVRNKWDEGQLAQR